MKKIHIFILALALFISAAMTLTPVLTAETNYLKTDFLTNSHTKAVCNDKNFCEDYEITCENKNILSIRATGFAVQFSPDWKDPREDKEIKC